jgi:hypothetical protein
MVNQPRNLAGFAAQSLSEFGPAAKRAVPALVRKWAASTNRIEIEAIAIAIKTIDPEAAAKAGVVTAP